MQCKPHIQAFNPTPLWFVERAGFLHGLNLFQGAFFSPWLQGTLRWLHPTAAQRGSHVDLGQSYSSTSGGGWCLPLVFLLHPGSFFLVLAHSASRTQQWGHVWSVQRTPEFSGKQLQWELLTRSSPGNAAESAVGWRKAALHSWFA